MTSRRAIVVNCDAIHLSSLGCYGNEWIETPALDRLAFDGIVFDQYFPVCPTAGGNLSAALTGRISFSPDIGMGEPPLLAAFREQGVEATILSDRVEGVPSFAEAVHVPLLPQAAWATEEEVVAHPAYRVPADASPARSAWLERWRAQLGSQTHLGDEAPRSLERLLERATDWCRKPCPAGGMLWLDLGFVSSPWVPPAGFLDRYREEGEPHGLVDPMPGWIGGTYQEADLPLLRAAHAGRIAYLDACLEVLFDTIRAEGLEQETLVLFSSDQGLPLGEHAAVGLGTDWLYEERAHAPLIVKGPGVRKASRSRGLAQSVDLFCLLATHFGIAVVGEGIDLLPVARGERPLRRDAAIQGLGDAEFALRTLTWNFLLPVRWPPATEGPAAAAQRTRQLFAKPEDRWDVNDQLSQNSALADRLELHLRRTMDAVQRGTLDRLPPLHESLAE